ncbi:superoxide dismutase [Blastomonas marina]|uniref:Superoxide dismutase [Cu-Zn] n=1 Tax=Blastomonas marina TaxID=1867408 RepID=A0ABQ1FHK0_9SPHN|nr:superoxide dismutase family protein [Blastomonas marina]GGA11179.1 superoxide dismutase [Blastomonas marina]
MTARILATVAAATALTGCMSFGDVPTARVGQATLSYANGAPAGTVQLLESGNRLRVTAAVVGAPEGVHGFHLHQTGTCARPDFTSAGGHLNPEGKNHGTLDPDGAHLGDLPNLIVAADGTGTIDAMLSGDRADAIAAIFDADGTAVVLHAGADDYKTDPSGDAGSRIACGVVSPT